MGGSCSAAALLRADDDDDDHKILPNTQKALDVSGVEVAGYILYIFALLVLESTPLDLSLIF